MPSAHIYLNKEIYGKAMLEENLSGLISVLLSNHYNSLKAKSSKEAEEKMQKMIDDLKLLEKEHENLIETETVQNKEIELFRKKNEEELEKQEKERMILRQKRREYEEWAKNQPDYVWKTINFDLWLTGVRKIDEIRIDKPFEY